MEQPAITILNAHRIMAVSTVRPDGWPQTTIVGYANSGFDIYFLIFRAGQKYANIQHEPRISLAVGAEPHAMEDLKAVYAGAIASEITDPAETERAWTLLRERHPNLADFYRPDASEAVLMRASCKHLSILDFSQGLGHTEALSLDLP
jgi:nitroimidazol reductase NimA-like FMN-containing flavoprotein (pyridoxamine 5'-phosphate oxidase superfamily)